MLSFKRCLSSKAPEKFMATTYSRPPLVLTKGKGTRVWDSTGKSYLDFTAGIAVTALGHSEPHIADIMKEQGNTLVHCSNLFYNEWTPKLSQSLIDKTHSSGAFPSASRVFVCNSGSEANEAALKFARKGGELQSKDKYHVLSFRGAFHGRTYGSLSATPNEKYQKPFAPMVPGFGYGTLNDFSSLDLITANTCAVIVEPIQGEGGVHPTSKDWLIALRAKCDEVGAMLIFDEIQCGLGRTGQLWAHHAILGDDVSKAQPDILTMAKALGNGFPIGATMISEKVNDVLAVGDHGTTFGGNPLACRVGDYVLGKVSSPEILGNVAERSAQIVTRAKAWATKFDVVSEVRGQGLLLGIQLTEKPDSVLAAARDNGLLVITGGTNTLRLVPALTITKDEVDEGLDILEDAIAKSF